MTSPAFASQSLFFRALDQQFKLTKPRVTIRAELAAAIGSGLKILAGGGREVSPLVYAL